MPSDPISVELLVFLAGTFAAAFVTGLAGFAFGMVAASVWLYALTPVQAAALIVGYALLVQGYAVWKLRRAVRLDRLWPFIAGSAVGIPAGAALLTWASPAHLRLAVGLLLTAFSLYNLLRPSLAALKWAGRWSDGGVGVLNGLLGGATGLGGVVPTLWCALRGWPRDEQRAVFQPTAVATFVMTIVWLGGGGMITADIIRLFVVGLPLLAAGTALGWMLYGRLDEAAFRRIVLALLLVSGLVLIVTST
jgi:uncharacterized membrane protein YfcA